MCRHFATLTGYRVISSFRHLLCKSSVLPPLLLPTDTHSLLKTNFEHRTNVVKNLCGRHILGLTSSSRLFCSASADLPSDHEDSGADAPPEDSGTGSEVVDQFLSALEGEHRGWWPLYVRGEVPDYPPRREMFDHLTSEGIDVERMEAFEIEDFTRWLLMRKKYGPGYPRMPYDVTLDQKIAELRSRIPLKKQSKF
ncbi:hypothetical protein BaOVIS_009470 [Babesia ovis]|uniref:Uncharacterized protein n=1 Tax=Babesia ovis TaxID=5869 RepID=A0A9W5T966_BABOV|nr:hypothetical protein BaOVIS_009470 [Babesia ovis]